MNKWSRLFPKSTVSHQWFLQSTCPRPALWIYCIHKKTPSPSYTKTNLERQTLIPNNEVFVSVRYLIVNGHIIQWRELISVFFAECVMHHYCIHWRRNAINYESGLRDPTKWMGKRGRFRDCSIACIQGGKGLQTARLLFFLRLWVLNVFRKHIIFSQKWSELHSNSVSHLKSNK